MTVLALVPGFQRLCTVPPFPRPVYFRLLYRPPRRATWMLSVLVLLSLELAFLILKTVVFQLWIWD